MAALTREAILAVQDLAREEVQVPEWGGSVSIKSMTGTERDAWEQSLVPAEGKAGKASKADVRNIRARLVAMCAVDEAGQRLFTDADVQALGAKSAVALDRCARVAQRLNGLMPEALEDAKGNSAAGPSGVSTSPSPSDSA
jgi:hypothetical protein